MLKFVRIRAGVYCAHGHHDSKQLVLTEELITDDVMNSE